MVGGISRPEPRRDEVAGEPALGDGGTVRVIAHGGVSSLTGVLSYFTRYPNCDSQIKLLRYFGITGRPRRHRTRRCARRPGSTPIRAGRTRAPAAPGHRPRASAPTR